MNRLRQPGDSDYDVLGLSPGATDEEIETAFRQLIDGQGFKVGVPLNRQWLRAREIKTAHATLADPVKRRAYDESLSRAPDPALWATPANDPATDKLVVPKKEPEAAGPVENRSKPAAVVPHDPDERTPTGSEPAPAPEEAQGPDADEAFWPADDPPPPDLDPAFNDNEQASDRAFDDDGRTPVRTWGVAAAVASGLALVLYSTWPGWNRQQSISERTPAVTAPDGQVSAIGPGVGHYSAQPPGSFGGAAVSDPQAQGAPPGDASAASDAPGQASKLQRAQGEGTMQGGGELAASDTAAAQSPANRTPTGTTAAATGTTAAATAASSAPTGATEARATAPAAALPVARAPAIAARPMGASSSGNLVGKAAEWVGGGPTDADNPRGRFQGSVAVQVTVEPGGRASNCAAVRGSGNAGLDALTCSLVRERARFTPALNAEGRPVVSEVYTTIVWGRRRRK